MADGSILKEILDSLHDVDSINFFAAANGLTGDDEVENRLKETTLIIYGRSFFLILDPILRNLDTPLTLKVPLPAFSQGVGMKKKRNLILYGRRIPGSSGKTWPVTPHSKSSSMSNGGGIN